MYVYMPAGSAAAAEEVGARSRLRLLVPQCEHTLQHALARF
jgi:hypothetical protein